MTWGCKRFMMRNRKLWVAVSLILALSLVLTACGGGGSKTKVIKIASISPLSGTQANMGETIKYGAELAINDRKADFEKLGYKLELVPFDDEAKPQVGTALAGRIVADKDILAVIGHLNSGVAIPSSEVYNRAGLVMVSPANTNPKITDRRLPTVNRICGRDDMQAPAGADFAFKQLGVKSVFLIHDKTDYGQGLADEFKKRAEELGMAVVGYEGITEGEVDFSAVLNLVAAANPDLVYYGGMYPEAGQIVKQGRAKGLTFKFMGADGIDNSDLVKIAGDAVVGVYYTSIAADLRKVPGGQEWAKRYEDAFKKPPVSFAAYGYDATMIVLNTLEKYVKDNPGKLPTREELANLVRKTENAKGIVTNVTFDDKGDDKNAKVFIYQFTSQNYPGEQVGESSGYK